MLDEYLVAKAAVDTFNLELEAFRIGRLAAEKELEALRQKRDDLAGRVIFIPSEINLLYLPKA